MHVWYNGGVFRITVSNLDFQKLHFVAFAKLQWLAVIMKNLLCYQTWIFHTLQHPVCHSNHFSKLHCCTLSQFECFKTLSRLTITKSWLRFCLHEKRYMWNPISRSYWPMEPLSISVSFPYHKKLNANILSNNFSEKGNYQETVK